VKLTDGFTGSEIEQVIIDAMFDCFDAGQDLDTPSVIGAVERTVPLSVTMAEPIKAMRQWAKHRARAAGVAEMPESTGRRRVAA